MTALLSMRLAAFVRTGRALAPLLAGLLILGVLNGGGRSQAGEAYAVSSVVLFPVLAWQTKLLLDIEPDVQRRLAVVALGRRREAVAGLLAAAAVGLVTVALALAVPWLLGGVTPPRRVTDAPLGVQLALGVWGHLVAVPAAVALGALASRVSTRGALSGLVVLACGVVGAIVLSLPHSPLAWLAPPLMSAARVMAGTADGVGVRVALLTAQAVIWTTAGLAGYAALRRRRA
ncbi:hypothetical protein [Plantactinospora sp. KBS50]|uniref:hypothetical protein n=1 Tax=Plantactinospora sp. KBS50 TaxID=2024580 RepID=UPI000BAB062F|nr:hypothetical protein [Plantactinospora sp. KBS50]ASW53522.1 hypothetical protein CIK06_04015 [Plantactinospora sp. KBS50]